MKDALQVVLTSPQFLFLIENSSTPDAEPLDDYELASKLSYFLWNGPPDADDPEAGRERRAARSSSTPKSTRMIADPRFARFTSEFASQWLALDKFAGARTGPQAVPEAHPRHPQRSCGRSRSSSSST